MAKKLSEQLTDLAVRAKHAEDAFTAAQKEAHDKIVVRKQQLLTESGHSCLEHPIYLVHLRRRLLLRRRALFLRHAAQRQPPFSKKYSLYCRP